MRTNSTYRCSQCGHYHKREDLRMVIVKSLSAEVYERFWCVCNACLGQLEAFHDIENDKNLSREE